MGGERKRKTETFFLLSCRYRLVTGVPYFTVQGQYAIEGADEPETFLEVFEKVKQIS